MVYLTLLELQATSRGIELTSVWEYVDVRSILTPRSACTHTCEHLPSHLVMGCTESTLVQSQVCRTHEMEGLVLILLGRVFKLMRVVTKHATQYDMCTHSATPTMFTSVGISGSY